MKIANLTNGPLIEKLGLSDEEQEWVREMYDISISAGFGVVISILIGVAYAFHIRNGGARITLPTFWRNSTVYEGTSSISSRIQSADIPLRTPANRAN